MTQEPNEPVMEEATRIDPLTPHPDRLATSAPGFSEIMQAHNAAVERGEPGYLDPFTGLFVMTAAFHAKRGKCCHNGCRHCPYVGAEEV